jgi:amidase
MVAACSLLRAARHSSAAPPVHLAAVRSARYDSPMTTPTPHASFASRAHRARLLLVALPSVLVAVHGAPLAAQGGEFRLEEATIAEIHAAFRTKSLTCHALVQRYLDRIDAIDKRGPAINALVTINPGALATADSLDRLFTANGPVGDLHCVPVIVKDNFETHDLQTTAGSLSLKGWVPRRDATMVARVRAAGGIVLAKSNLAEWAFTPYETVSSILPGYTKNPYALDRVTAGSSGGTAAAVAANEGTVGLGSDTGNSIRGPSAHNALVGIRSTMGLTSRAGVVPLNSLADIAGPMTRTVSDAVAVLQAVAGEDPDDPVTATSRGHREPDYRAFLVPGGLRGSRIGVLRQAYERPTTDAEVVTVFDGALAAMRRAGATIIDTADVPGLDSILEGARGGCNRFRYDLETYLAARGEGAPVQTVDAVLRSGAFHPSVQLRLQQAQAVTQSPDELPGCAAREAMRERLRGAVVALMDSLQLDALVYPTWSNVPRLIGDLNTPHGDNSQLFSPLTGFPAITVPMGYTRGGTLPAGISFFGRPWSEGRLITVSYGFEQATRHRRPPAPGPS